MSEPLILVDGSSYLFRAFHALPQLESSKGFPTGAVKGVIAMIRKLMDDYAGSAVTVVFDAKGKSFRNEIFAEYKANRTSMPSDLRKQIEPIHAIIGLMGLPLLIVDGVEADDVIGTLANAAKIAKRDVVISTGDKDMAQLVGDHVTLINTMTDTVMDATGVVDKFGVRPDQIIDYLALIGDTSDNIPGVPKVGPKTAVKWLAQYETIDGVVANADAIKGKVGENLRAALDQLPLSKTLATIRLDVELPLGLDELVPAPADETALLEIYTELEFKPWVEELAGAASAAAPTDYIAIRDRDGLDRFVQTAMGEEEVAIALMTSDSDYMRCDIYGIGLCTTPGHAAFVPIGEGHVIDLAAALEAMRHLLGSESPRKVGHDLKFTINVLRRLGVPVAGIGDDSMLASYVLNSVASKHQLDDLAMKYLGRSATKFEDIAGKGAKQLTLDLVEDEKALHYAAEYADLSLQLSRELGPRLSAEQSLGSVYRDIEIPLLEVLSRVEGHGVLLDVDQLNQQSKEIAERLATLEAEAYELAGETFNLGSTKQLQHIFFDKLELPVLKKTPKGQPSTAEPVLQELALDFPLPAIIMEHRGLAKLKSTYTDHLPLEVVPSTGRVHTTYHQAVAATGRLSSADPNLQNIPIRTDEGRRVRKAFVAPPGCKLIAADYSQIELRIMAHLSRDEGLLTAFAQGLDIHRATAAEVFGVALEDVKDVQRRSSKAINFGLIYGMSAFGLARQLSIGRADAQDYIDTYFERYPGVRRYMDETRERAARDGFVETLFGRRLYLPDIKASNFMRRQGAERQAINAPMQGSAADIIKRAMIAVDQWLTVSNVAAKMIMQVHDELVLEVADADVEQVKEAVGDLMSGAADLAVPLVVEPGVGESWDSAH
jgi:DNA polymerase-1